MYDTSSAWSLRDIAQLLCAAEAILSNLYPQSLTVPAIPIALVGNKTDKARKVLEEDGRQLAKSYGAGFFETSARDNEGIYEPFLYLLEKIAAVRDAPSSASEESSTAHKPRRTDVTQPIIQPSISNGSGTATETGKDFEMSDSSELDRREVSWWHWIHFWVCVTGGA